MNETLVPCSNCGRKFSRSRVSKHQSICRKSCTGNRRPIFDSAKQRAQGTDILLLATSKTSPLKKNAIPRTNWRQKHQEFISAIRNARKAVVAVRTGKPLPPPPPPAENPDYITCRSCYRRFNAQAAARHIPVCTNRRKEMGEPVSFAFRTIPADYGSKNYHARQYAKTVPKPTVSPRRSILKRNANSDVPKQTNALSEDVMYEEDWPITNRSIVSNSTTFPYNGCKSERIYQDQPNVLTNTGLAPVMLSGNRYKQYSRPAPGLIVGTRLPKKIAPQPQVSRSLPSNAVLQGRCGNTKISSRSLPTPAASKNPRPNARISSLDTFKHTGQKLPSPRRQGRLDAGENHGESQNIAYTFGNMCVYED